MAWQVVFTKQAVEDAKKLAASDLRPNAEKLLAILTQNPFQSPPPFEKLQGDLIGAYSGRINIQHRLVYQVVADEQVVKVLRVNLLDLGSKGALPQIGRSALEGVADS